MLRSASFVSILSFTVNYRYWHPYGCWIEIHSTPRMYSYRLRRRDIASRVLMNRLTESALRDYRNYKLARARFYIQEVGM